MKIQKGDYGYIKHQKKIEILKTSVMFALVLIIFIAGYVTTKTRLNLFTLVAVLGCLPASKELVSLIMILPRKGLGPGLYEKISPKVKKSSVAYEMVMTSYEKTMPLDCMAILGNTMIGYAGSEKADVSLLEKHLRDICNGNKYKVSIKIFKDLDAFLDRLAQLEDKGEPSELQDAVLNTMKAVSL
ncbi:hypothetical protein [Diplocloster modestus]|uniref:Uncharacterized protein n=1 Tax=Diplocloster modestus TaxID=2850322 RepID=A0ABS6K9D4_9FIRM|nr:hypothetical protein [Diplocloster modestus]MBU9727120.1 hypothetical protein [Diplocloster modestus]